MSTQSISIAMSQETVQTLVQNGYSLYAFRAVASSIASACPTVWFASRDFSMVTQIDWADQYASYVSLQTVLGDGVEITASASYDIEPGETLHVTGPAGLGTVQQSGTAGAIGIVNETGTQFTCGISQPSGAGTAPICAAPLLGWNLNLFQPVDKVLLAFEAPSRSVGSVVHQLLAPSLLIDLSGTAGNTAQVTYDVSRGWSDNVAAWAKPTPAGTDITKLLILQNEALAATAARGTQRLKDAAIPATAG